MGFQLWAVLSALFAGVTAILAKKGVEEVPPNLAIAIRVTVVLVLTWAIAFATKQVRVGAINHRAWIYLAASGLGTGASWLCYFRALKLGPVAKVAPIDKLSFVVAMILGFLILNEKPTLNLVAGATLIVAGVLLTLR
jgi:transporter family protein